MANWQLWRNSAVVIVGDSAVTSLALWRHAAVHRPRVVYYGLAEQSSWVASRRVGVVGVKQLWLLTESNINPKGCWVPGI